MSSDTVDNLKKDGSQLYGFKAVKTSEQGKPLVWFSTNRYLANTTVSWQENYQAYVSTQLNLTPGAIINPCILTKRNKELKKIVACSAQIVTLGEQMLVDEYGSTSVIWSKKANAISVLNQAQTQWSSGVSQVVEDDLYRPLSIFPLYGRSQLSLMPLKKVLLAFGTQSIEAGTIISESPGPGILVDLTDIQSRDLTYDINDGWQPSDQVWAQIIPVNSDITPLLIEQQ